MTEGRERELWVELADLAQVATAEQLDTYLDGLSSEEVALAMSRLSGEDRTKVLTKLAPEDAADVVEQLPEVQAVDLIGQMQPTAAAAILDELPSDEQADLLGELHSDNAEAILQEMAPEEAADARILTQFDDHVAGGLMVTEFLLYPVHFSVEDVIDDLRQHAEEYRDYDIQYAYVCDAEKRLTGVLRLRDLLLSGRQRLIAEIMIRDPLSLPAETSLDELSTFFDSHHYLGVPIIDARGKLLGVVQKAAVDEAWGDQREDEFLRTQGIVGEEIRAMPLFRRSRRRLAWLSVNILLNLAAASVIAAYQETLLAVIALAVFLPIISDMSGCSGNQAVAVSLRELALGLVRPFELFRVWLKEVSVGLINGVVLGMLIGAVAWIWKGNPYLGLVVGLALCLNTMVAVSIGGIVPLILKRYKMDPAIASGPILTTVTDMCGFFFVLGLATLMLPYLTG